VEGSFGRVGRWLDRNVLTALTLLSALSLVFFEGFVEAALAGSWTYILLSCLAFIIICVHLYVYSKEQKDKFRIEKENKELSEEIAFFKSVFGLDQQEYGQICDDMLAVLAKGLGFNGQDRISLYKRDANFFFIIGRYSENPDLARRRRREYPASEGFIGKAWAAPDRVQVFSDIPAFAERAEEYYKAHESVGVSRETVRNFHMKSRYYAAIVIGNETDLQRSAIIIIESYAPRRFSKETIANFGNSDSMRLISCMLRAMKANLPSPAFAREKGF